MRGTRSVVAVLAFLVFAGPASAANFTVNSTLDAADAAINGTCATSAASGSKCTLPAAIAEANATPAPDSIGFASNPFAGKDSSSTIAVSATQVISKPLTIDGGNCGSASSPQPCVAVKSTKTAAGKNATQSALSVTSSDVVIRGVAINSELVVGGPAGTPQTGIVIRGNWFGSMLNGALAQEDIFNRLRIGSDVSGAVIGGTTPADRNLFNGTGQSLAVIRGDDTVIQGNWFGQNPDGTLQAVTGPYGLSIGEPGGAIGTVERTLIGGSDDGTATGESAGTPETCDGPCNVINASLYLWAAPGGAAGGATSQPVLDTSIKGNMIGNYNVLLQVSSRTVVGGPSPGDRNYFGGPVSGTNNQISSGTPVTFENNWFGLAPDGHSALRAPGLRGQGLIQNNRFAAPQGIGIPAAIEMVNRSGSTIRDNVFGKGTNGEELGYPDQAITVVGSDPKIGGPNPSDGNKFFNGGGDPIEVSGSSQAVVRNNRGVANKGIMLDITPAQGRGAVNVPAPPVIDSITGTTVAGHIPGCTGVIGECFSQINAYNVNATEFTPIGVGGTTFDGTGTFSFQTNSPDCVAVTQGGDFEATSELSDGFSARGASNCDLSPPNTVITSGPGSTASAPPGTADLALKLSASPDPVIVGDDITYALEVTNNGPDVADEVAVSDVLPANVTFKSSSSECTDNSGTVSCDLDGLTNGQTKQATIAATTTETGTVTNSASVSGRGTDSTPGNDTATVTTQVLVAAKPTTGGVAPPAQKRRAGHNKPKSHRGRTFRFKSHSKKVHFECRVDNRPFRKCSRKRSHVVRGLKRGRHLFRVRAIDKAGNVDPTPAARQFKVK